MKKRKAAAPARAVGHERDFKKIKRKVGKKAPMKANVTNTSFATKSIHVPNQKMAEVDNVSASLNPEHASSATTNSRQLNLHDLFGQIKHYSAHIRREALVGLKDLLQRHAHLLSVEAANLFQLVLPCLLDEDKSVRTALLALLAHMFPLLGSSGVAPFQGLLVSYVCSGLSHMHFAVKRSALQALKSLMDLEKSGAGASTSTGAFLLWQGSHAQLLPNLLACMSERVFVAKQANIATTEELQGKGKNKDHTAGSSTGNLANRALMLQTIEQFLSLCPYAAAGSETSSSTSSSTAAASSDSLTMSIAPCLLHSSALHALVYADASASDLAAAVTANDAAAIVVGAKPVPMKYARKSAGQAAQLKYYSTPTAASSSAAASAAPVKVLSPLNKFVDQLLPLSVEYWLESFGLASNTPSASGGMGGATPVQAQVPNKNTPAELLANLQALLRLMRLSMSILRAQRGEKRRNDLIESGGVPKVIEVTTESDAETLGLPQGFAQAVRTHLFTAFPLSAAALGPTALAIEAAGRNEQQARSLHALNAECVALMACFLSPAANASTVVPAAAPSDRRKSGVNRAMKQATEDEQWLQRIVDYMASSFGALTDASQAKAEARRLSFAPAAHSKDGEQDDVDMEGGETDQVKEEETVPAAAAAASSAAVPAMRNGRPMSTKKKRASYGGAGGGSGGDAKGLEHGSLADLLPLVQTLLPRLAWSRQQGLVSSFLSYYLHCHPLSNSKLACLSFLHAHLLSPERGSTWFGNGATDLREQLIDQGEWAGLVGVVAAAIGNQLQIQAMKADDDEDADMEVSANGAPTPLLRRYYDMLEILISLLLNAGRLFHGVVLDYDLVQGQLVSFFGVLESEEDGGRVTPGPFWTLPLALQHRSIQLVYYFTNLSHELTRVLLECLRDHTSDSMGGAAALISFESKELVLDMLGERHVDLVGGLPAYLALIMGMVRSDLLPHRTELGAEQARELDARNVSPLLPIACRLLRGIGPEELESLLGPEGAACSSPSSGGNLLFELLAPNIASCLAAPVDGAQPAKLDVYSSLLLVDALMPNNGAALPSSITTVLPGALWRVLAGTLSGSALEAGSVQTPQGWLDTPSESCLQNNQPWLLAFCILLRAGDQVACDLLQQMHTLLKVAGTAGRDSALQVVVLLASFAKCTGLRSWLRVHQASFLSLCNLAASTPGIASATLLAQLHSEVTTIFGRQAVASG